MDLDWREQVLNHKGLREYAVLELASRECFAGNYCNVNGCIAYCIV
jgi:hypothetical protein